MPSSGILRSVALAGTAVSEERSAYMTLHSRIVFRRVRRLLVTANVVPSSPILFALMTEARHSYGTSVITRVTRRNIPEDGIHQSQRRENLKSYKALRSWA
jgi:hypothetical protein